jgi:tyrosinase
MLAKYSQAVALMKGSGLGDPCSWLFQANTHWVRSNTTKAALIATLPAAQQPLANDMWNTCQNHGGMTTEDMFLPWHRMYVYYLEKIVRMVLNDPSFALPYWNYNAAATASLPQAFINPASSSNPLYYPYRNPGPQSGAPLTDLDLSALNQSAYSAFCSQLDFGLHGNVHVKVGNSSQGMGSVAWAANDPIFWMHHSNIDRLWASWNAAGRTNPTTADWTGQTFVFANPGGAGCAKVIAKVGDFSSIATLGYAYDRLEPVRRIPGKWPFLVQARPLLLKGPGPVELVKGANQVRLVNAGTKALQAPANAPLLQTRLQRLTSDKRIHLLLEGLMANEAPGVTYSVYLNPADSAPQTPDPARLVGVVNFFAGVMPDGNKMPQSPQVSFDVTDVLRKLGTKGALGDNLTISLVPDGEVSDRAKPTIESFSLAEV